MADVLEVIWEGADGSVWDLLDFRSPVQASSISGLGLPDFRQQWAEMAGRDGARYEGTTWGSATITMTVTVGDSRKVVGAAARRTGDEWRALDRSWRRSLSPERPGKLTIVSGSGRRSLELRLDQPAPPPPGRNPALSGEATYQLTLTAGDSPWWTGEELTRDFQWTSVSQPFFGGDDGQVLLYISKSSATDGATITNTGDREAWARWWARGPFTSVSLGIDGNVVRLPFALAAGQLVYVDSFEHTITDANGVSLWPLMGYSSATFGPIPPGGEVPLEIVFTGPRIGAALGVGIVPRYEGPW